jgi:DNA-binding NarL/FixJ family response regulator
MKAAALPYRILIVDDHRILRQGVRLLLERSTDFHVVGDTDGNRIFPSAVELKPDVVLIDLRLPRFEDGLNAIEQLKANLPDVRIIALTVPGDDGDAVYRAVRHGAVGCVLKNTSDLSDVEEAIRQVAQGRPYLSGTALRSLVDTIVGLTDNPAPSGGSTKGDELSPREEAVLELVALGHTNREIAEKLVISESTVRSHLHNILDKLQLSNRVQAAAFALRSTKPGDGTIRTRKS